MNSSHRVSISSVLLAIYFGLAPFEYVLATEDGTVARWIALIYLPVAIFEIHRSRRRLFLGDPLVWPVILLVCLAWFSVIWSHDISISVSRNVVYTFLPALYLVAIWRGLSQVERHLLNGAIMLGAWVAFGSLAWLEPELLLGEASRLSVTEASDPNNFAALFVLPIFVALSSVFSSASWTKAFYGVSCTAFLLIVFMTGSRGALVGLGAAVVVMIVLGAREWGLLRTSLMIGGMLAASLVAATFLPENISARLFGEGALLRGIDVDGARFDIWGVVWERVLPITPPWGQGSGVAPYLLQDWFGETKGVHNTFLTLLVEYGLLGLPIVLFFIWALLRTARRESVFVLGALVAILVISFFLDSYAKKFLWNIFMYVALASPGSRIDKLSHDQKSRGRVPSGLSL